MIKLSFSKKSDSLTLLIIHDQLDVIARLVCLNVNQVHTSCDCLICVQEVIDDIRGLV